MSGAVKRSGTSTLGVQRRKRDVSSSYGTTWNLFCERVVQGIKIMKCIAWADFQTAGLNGVFGSDPSAAGGGYSEVSEWQRSKFQAPAVRQRRNFGYRNRDLPPRAKVGRAGARNTPAVGDKKKRNSLSRV